ncbi:MAG TPA: phosphoadenosine phosphosulfate reductase family protein [Butyricimonas virosa]|uniref:Phosphoadenosine phosphosulfate reductase family protein n=1 Tax=Butyricimonas virosa TaxID=544645 RepID=A0A921KYM7_9BACT|nr:phosphoadenosine phosphosulfate reductase family protein [Butyricimonas virosa]
MNLFADEIEQQAIKRIQKFEKIAKAMNFEIILGFSGGKDSQVVYDLCKRSGITFKACFNHCFESQTTLKFIKEKYPEVEWRRSVKTGFIENIWVNHNGIFPTVHMAYCCADYKHNQKSVEKCSIVGVRRAESARRKARTLFEIKNKTLLKKNKHLIDNYFEERCQSVGINAIIQLKPIIDWSDNDVWDYIKKYKLPINPEYNMRNRIGCIVCPKASFTSNYIFLIKYPKLISAFIQARENSKFKINWIITGEDRDYSDDKCYYICRWLNHSFMPFTKKQEELYRKVREKYNTTRDNLDKNSDI